MDIIKNRYWYFLLSLLIIIPGLVFMGLHWSKTGEGPLTLGIDFKGGALLEVEFSGGRPPLEQINALYEQFSTAELPIAYPDIQPLGDNAYATRSKAMDDATKGALVEAMQQATGSTVTVLNFTNVKLFLDRHLQLFKIPEISEYGTSYVYRNLPNDAASAI